jgi:hypothetical protein
VIVPVLQDAMQLDAKSSVLVVGVAPQHDAAVVGRAFHRRQHLGRERVRVNEPAARGVQRRREAQEHDRGRQARRPLLPRAPQRADVPGRVLARRVVVELHPHVVEQPRAERRGEGRVRERALRRRGEHVRPAPRVAPVQRRQVPGEVVVVPGRGLDVEVDAVEHRGAERAGRAGAAEEAVPEVRGDALRVRRRGKVVAAERAAADAEEHLDDRRLAGRDVGGEGRAAPRRGIAVAAQVEGRGAAVAERGEEGDADVGVEARAARVPERALAGVLAPVQGDFDVAGGRRGEDGRHCKKQGRRVEAELAGHRGVEDAHCRLAQSCGCGRVAYALINLS